MTVPTINAIRKRATRRGLRITTQRNAPGEGRYLVSDASTGWLLFGSTHAPTTAVEVAEFIADYEG